MHSLLIRYTVIPLTLAFSCPHATVPAWNFPVSSHTTSYPEDDMVCLAEAHLVGENKVLDPRQYCIVIFATFGNGEVGSKMVHF